LESQYQCFSEAAKIGSVGKQYIDYDKLKEMGVMFSSEWLIILPASATEMQPKYVVGLS